jgi:hypothetical protein
MDATTDDCEREGIVFLPLAAESLGGWHPVAVHQVYKLGAALARHTGDDEQVVSRQLWQRLAILLQRGNAALLVNQMPWFPLRPRLPLLASSSQISKHYCPTLGRANRRLCHALISAL